MKMPSPMVHQFSEVPEANIQRSVFNRSQGYKTTFNSGDLIPFYVDEALPGDTFNYDATLFARLATPLVPIMDNMYLDTFFFAVPMRLVWDNFQKFMGERDDTSLYDPTDYLIPTMTSPSGGFAVGSLADYFGLPTLDQSGFGQMNARTITVSCLWHRGYNLIWNTFFRDENIQPSVVVDKDDSASSESDYVVLKRGKRHDYFTSCLPWPQKGPGVELPLGTVAPVIGIGKVSQVYDSTPTNVYVTGQSAPVSYTSSYQVSDANADSLYKVTEDANNSGYPGIYADLSSASAATINSLREAFQLQKLYERDARGGTRYVEIIKSHFGVTSPDARLQRPELLGMSSTPIIVNPVASQAYIAPNFPQGHLSGIGTAGDTGVGFTKSFTEHCLLFGLVSVRADLTYQCGIPRMFSRSTRFDFYWPALANLGEQAVLNKEIYAQGANLKDINGVDDDDDLVFGYQERWAEYRYGMSKITGELRSKFSTPLDVWHLSQDFTSLPTLSDTFIVENPPVDRVVAVTDEPQFIFDSFMRIKCARPMPVYSVPGLIDHF